MIRMVATTRIIMPETQVRLSAGRMNMSRRSSNVLAGANSILQATNCLRLQPDVNEDMKMFEMLGLNPQSIY
jgi:biotin synthase